MLDLTLVIRMWYDRRAFFKKRGVKVKAKLKSMGIISIAMVIILNVYLVHLNIGVSKYQKAKEYESIANYIEIENEELALDNVEEVIEQNPIVYDGKTLDELSETIEKSLASTISGKGYLIASYALEKGVDPYMATAIILHETGCKWGCSRLVYECNNVGGQKGQGCGSYAYFTSLDEGIRRFIDNLYKNYISYGLTTPETINPKYAEDPNWAVNVNKYIENIKAQ